MRPCTPSSACTRNSYAHRKTYTALMFGARGGTRTHTALRPLRPERSASTNSATRAGGLSCSLGLFHSRLAWFVHRVLRERREVASPSWAVKRQSLMAPLLTSAVLASRRCGTVKVHLDANVRHGVPQNWCPRGDSNPHVLSDTATSTLRVYQFRHLGRWNYMMLHIIPTNRQNATVYVVGPRGFKPPTSAFVALRSVQLSYGPVVWRGRQDSNLRIPGSEPGALGLSASLPY